MKKFILHLIILLIVNCQLSIIVCKAQPNGGFENWITILNSQEPENWQTMNFLSNLSPPNPVSAFKATGVDKHSGNFALKLKTIFINNNPVPGTIRDTVGLVFTGKLLISPPAMKLGIPYTGRPETFEFWAKYIPVGEDLAGMTATLQKWNGISADTIAFATVGIDSTLLTYTFFQIALDYYSTAVPDTLIMGFASSRKSSEARVGSTLFIDDVELTGWVGIDEKKMYADKVQLFPNPARENLTISVEVNEAENIRIVDVLGKRLGVFKIQNQKVNINISSFAEGIYFYEIRDKEDKILTKNKFSVVK